MDLSLRQQDIAATIERNGIKTKTEAIEFVQKVFGSTANSRDIEKACASLKLK